MKGSAVRIRSVALRGGIERAPRRSGGAWGMAPCHEAGASASLLAESGKAALGGPTPASRRATSQRANPELPRCANVRPWRQGRSSCQAQPPSERQGRVRIARLPWIRRHCGGASPWRPDAASRADRRLAIGAEVGGGTAELGLGERRTTAHGGSVPGAAATTRGETPASGVRQQTSRKQPSCRRWQSSACVRPVATLVALRAGCSRSSYLI